MEAKNKRTASRAPTHAEIANEQRELDALLANDSGPHDAAVLLLLTDHHGTAGRQKHVTENGHAHAAFKVDV